jgi:hypothetical protein
LEGFRVASLDSPTATIAQVGEIMTTEITTKKAAVLDEVERMVSAAPTHLTDSKKELVETTTAECKKIGHDAHGIRY